MILMAADTIGKTADRDALACQLLREMKAEVAPVEDRPKITEPAKTPADKRPKGS
jgi:hypothetical protein